MSLIMSESDVDHRLLSQYGVHWILQSFEKEFPMSSKAFEDRVVLVTGAASGIGRATALAFAQASARVVVADVSEEGGKKTLKLIEAYGREGLFVRCDVSNFREVTYLIDKTLKSFGRLDVAFNNAGIEGLQADTEACTEENFDRVIATNLKGVWLCMKYEIEQMLKQGTGAIVNCASIAGLVGFPKIPAYVASKHGVIGLTKTAALEFATKGIRINAVCPGAIMTPMLARFAKDEEEARKNFSALEPMGRVGKPEEIANAVLWLSSPQASFITGQALAVDGGWLAK